MLHYFAENAKNAREGRVMARLAELADEFEKDMASMPEWAAGCPQRVCNRVPLVVIAENSENRVNIVVRCFATKRGKQMVEVAWRDRYGEHKTQAEGTPDRVYFAWDNFEW